MEKARALQPDVILMDISMPVLNGIEATGEMLAANPKAKMLILSAHDDDKYVKDMTAVGAVGLLKKQTVGEYSMQAIHEVVSGYRFFSRPSPIA